MTFGGFFFSLENVLSLFFECGIHLPFSSDLASFEVIILVCTCDGIRFASGTKWWFHWIMKARGTCTETMEHRDAHVD